MDEPLLVIDLEVGNRTVLTASSSVEVYDWFVAKTGVFLASDAGGISAEEIHPFDCFSAPCLEILSRSPSVAHLQVDLIIPETQEDPWRYYIPPPKPGIEHVGPSPRFHGQWKIVPDPDHVFEAIPSFASLLEMFETCVPGQCAVTATYSSEHGHESCVYFPPSTQVPGHPLMHIL